MTTRHTPSPPPDSVAALSEVHLQRRRQSGLDLSIRCRLVTPLFGGGSEAAENDLLSPVSPKGIRGQLRHWWRRVAGEALPVALGLSATEIMSLREAEVFGSAELPSPMNVSVQVLTNPPLARRNPGDPKAPYGFSRFGPEAYALFPVVQKAAQGEPTPGLLMEGLEFEVALNWLDEPAFARRTAFERDRRQERNRARRNAGKPEWPGPWEDVREVRRQAEIALWTWLNFGGVGSRTRRGVGALATDAASFSLLDEDGRLRHTVPGMTILVAGAKTGGQAAMAAWSESVNAYRQFRQRRGPGRPGKRAPGRSLWPEPDSLRQITGCALQPLPSAGHAPVSDVPDHSVPSVDDPVALPGFPRAMLGLPIIFHFAPGEGQDEKRPQTRFKDPSDALLVPRVVQPDGETGRGDRMSSPVITRPLVVEGHWRPAVIILRGRHLEGLEAHLTVKGVDAHGGTEDKDRPISRDWIVSPRFGTLRPMQGQQDALAGLQTYLTTSRGFEALAAGPGR